MPVDRRAGSGRPRQALGASAGPLEASRRAVGASRNASRRLPGGLAEPPGTPTQYTYIYIYIYIHIFVLGVCFVCLFMYTRMHAYKHDSRQSGLTVSTCSHCLECIHVLMYKYEYI
jgi:hypothetical protein